MKPGNKLLFLLIIFFYSQVGNAQSSKIKFWEEQQKGTNYFNAVPCLEWFESAASENIKFVRFTFAKWQGEERDFLMGNADNFTNIIEADFQKLLKYLNIADSLGIKIVVTPISLPGARWSQNNNGVRDGRLWKDEVFQQKTVDYWSQLATKLKGHPAIVGYNIKNEPHPEYYFGKTSFWEGDLKEWYNSIEGTTADLNLFYTKIISAIRKVDTEMPIIIESGLYATAWACDYLKKIDDNKIIYSFHMYEPYDFSTFKINKGRYCYPGEIPIPESDNIFQLNKSGLQDFLKPVIDWAKQNDIPANRIWVGEFGCSRKVQGVENYLADLIDIFNKQQWHWCFYSYREDVWDDMDYELGTGKVNWKYWEYSENNSLHLNYNEIYNTVNNNTVWPVFQKEFQEK